MNLSRYSDRKTARTNIVCARQRAENLAILGAKSVLELCVGPSLLTLSREYAKVGIKTTGNDIDPRWQRLYLSGKWIIGDARKIDARSFDAVVVAPPLSRGCSGKREDALSIDEVVPSYYDFLHLNNRVVVFVLPGKTLSLRSERAKLHKLLAHIGDCEAIPLRDKVVKYLDLYKIRKENQ
jgi:hypothetical protein